MITQTVGENIRVLRTIKGYSQEGLARKIGKSQNWMQQVEKGELELSLTNLETLSEELGVAASYLLTFEPKQVFNNCTQSGTFNNCTINSEKLINDIIRLLQKPDFKQ